jgi:PIN domain nuclease of toxin-antitoxin system
MILLDTHIWLWWTHGDENLPIEYFQLLQQRESEGLGVSVISCWEIAKLVEYNRLTLPYSVNEWFKIALSYPNIKLLNLSSEIAIESTQLPKPFHKDPTDQIIVATARIYDCPLITVDSKICSYPYVALLP